MAATKRRTARPLTTLQVAHRFTTAHLGAGAFAPLTGTDGRAYRVFVHAVELYPFAREEALTAMRAALTAAQRRRADIAAVFLQAIPALLDWSDALRIWPLVSADFPELRPQRRNTGWRTPAAGGDS